MSNETWWMLTWAKTGEIIEVFHGEPRAYCHNAAFTLTPVRIVPVGAEPCGWETVPQFDDGRRITRGEWDAANGYNFCPNCGRRLEER